MANKNLTATWLYTVIALCAFAANFLICRIALAPGQDLIDPASFSTIRLLGGAVFVGQNSRMVEWAGLAVSLSGLVYMVFPLLRLPSLAGLIFMVAAGMAWGMYCLGVGGARRAGSPPLVMTAGN